jgi:hypothetical protein
MVECDCAHCVSIRGYKKGVRSDQFVSDSGSDPDPDQRIDPPIRRIKSPRVRGKARDYTPAFEVAWREYGRKEGKLEAFGVWLLKCQEFGGEALLLPQIITSLRWQSRIWERDNWNFAPYFVRYLKQERWNDEPRAVAPYRRRPDDDRLSRSTEVQISRLRAAAGRQATPGEIAELAALRKASR